MHPESAAPMGLWESCFLGVLQGLTEFLPISSSGHLAVAQRLLPSRPADPVAVEVALHFGTLVAVVIYFARDLGNMARAFVRPTAGPEYARRWVGLIALGTLPGLIVYNVAGRWIENAFESLAVIGGNLLLTALVLAATAIVAPGRKGEAEIRPFDALIIGLFQGAALMPGISRSGFTIVGGLFAGLRGEVAARFSFLLAIPAIVGAELVKLPDFLARPVHEAANLSAGMLVAGISGLVAIDVLLRLVRREKLRYFAIYCAVGGALAVAAGLGGW